MAGKRNRDFELQSRRMFGVSRSWYFEWKLSLRITAVRRFAFAIFPFSQGCVKYVLKYRLPSSYLVSFSYPPHGATARPEGRVAHSYSADTVRQERVIEKQQVPRRYWGLVLRL